MKTYFEKIYPDEGYSFRLLHQKVSPKEFNWQYHYHPEIELVFVRDGVGRRHVGNHLSYYQDGDLVLIGSNTPHAGFGYGSLCEHEEIVVQFTEDFMGNALETNIEFAAIRNLLGTAKQGLCFYGEAKRQIGKQLLELEEYQSFDRLIHLLKIFKQMAASHEVRSLNSANTLYEFSQKDQARLIKIYDYISRHYQEDIEIQKIADLANLTVPAFCNYFKKIMQMTFTEFLNDFRINKACNLILEEKSITDVCYEAGFNNVSYFSKVFKESKGQSPQKFKKMVLRQA